MTPDLGTRLGTVITALRQVVIPALPADEVLAVEQAMLCIGQLGVLSEQYRYEADYEALCLAEMTGLAGTLLADADGGPATTAAAAELRAVLDRADAAPGLIPASLTYRRRNAIAAAVDLLLQASAQDGTTEFLADSQRAVVEHGVRQAGRDRAWFRACGMDPDAGTLPGIPEMLEAGTR
jgi:hypothetical protein